MLLSLSYLTFPAIDPVLLEIGPIAIRWYALAYMAGILLGYFTIKRLDSEKSLSKNALDDLVLYAIIGIMLGGRLGYVLFYKFSYYLENPSEAFMIWQGGMSFHGGLLGVILAFYLFARRYQLSYLSLMDKVACAAPIGLFFGRLANFINAELYGRPSDVPWAMVFPHSDGQPRHPSQLYEALLEGALLFVVLYLVRRHTSLEKNKGALAGLFLMGYAASRAFVEMFREPDAHLGFLAAGLTMGQLLCVPMFLLGTYLIWNSKRA